MNRAAPLDFAAIWNEFAREGDHQDAAFDLAFWEEFAAGYDVEPVTSDHTLQVLASLVRPEDTLLDVGTGTGRFALPLSERVSYVTAVDYSPPMLSILRRKTQSENRNNIDVIEADWETAALEPHDVVLAAWALYRQTDILAALRRLLAATRRLFIIVDGDAFAPPHDAAARRIWGADDEPDIPNYLYLLGALWQIGILADLRVVYEMRSLCGETPSEIAVQLAPPHANGEEISRYTADISSLMEPVPDGWRYAFAFPVGILSWECR